MDLNPICQPSPANKMKCYFVDYVQLLMLARLVNGLKPHPPPLSSQTNEMLPFGLCSLLMISQAGRWTQTPSITLLQPIKWNAHFWITFNFWWLAGLVNGLKLPLPPLSSQKHEMLLFGLRSTSDDRLGWSMDSNPIHHPSPAKKMKSSFLYYVEVLVISRAGWWTRTPSATPLQPKKWNAHFWILFKFWWLAGLVDGLEPHPPPLSTQKKWNAHFWIMFNFWWLAGLVNGLKLPLPPLCSQKNEILIFGFCSNSDDWLGWLMDSNPIHHPSAPKKMKCSFWIMFNFWWSARLLYSTPLSCQKMMLIFGLRHDWLGWLMDSNPIHHPSPPKKNEMLIFGLCSTSDDWLGWSMDWNSLCYPSPAKNMNCYFLDYVQLLMIGWAGQWTQTPSTTPLQPKEWNAHFCITFNMRCWPDWSMDLNLIHHPSAPKKMKWSFWIMFNFWWSARLLYGLKLPLPPLSSQKHEMLIFGLRSTSDDRLGWLMDSNPILHPSPAKTVKCSFLYYIQHVMLARLVNGLEPHPPPLCTQKNEMVILDYVQLLMISQAALWTQTHLPPLSCQKIKCLFLDYVQLLMISWAARWTWTRSTPHLQPENWNAHILIMFNFWW